MVCLNVLLITEGFVFIHDPYCTRNTSKFPSVWLHRSPEHSTAVGTASWSTFKGTMRVTLQHAQYCTSCHNSVIVYP